MSELADELDSKSSGKPCGFEPHYRHSNDRHTFTVCLSLSKKSPEKVAFLYQKWYNKTG